MCASSTGVSEGIPDGVVLDPVFSVDRDKLVVSIGRGATLGV